MNLNLLLIFLLPVISVCAEMPVKYYIGQTEVSSEVWNSVPDSIKNGSSVVETDSIIYRGFDLKLEYYVDSLSDPSTPIIRQRSAEDLEFMRRQIREFTLRHRDESLRLHEGDPTPLFSLTDPDSGHTTADPLQPGICYLINFWATWCSNCLIELRQEEIPALIRQFGGRSDFRFIPVCIDTSVDILNKWFESDTGKQWIHIKPLTMIDPDRLANSIFATPGILPLNVVIGTDGKIKYIHSGRLSTPEQFKELENAIKNGLNNTTH